MAVTVSTAKGRRARSGSPRFSVFQRPHPDRGRLGYAGDIVAFAGIAEPKVSDTVCDPLNVEALPSLTVERADHQP